jgi:acyl-CoA hydrolase
VTASVNKVDFLNPIEVGELITLKASVNYTGNSSMLVGLRVEAENIQKGIVKHCNSSYFTMVARDDNGQKVKVPGLILDTEESVRRFVRSMYRKEQSLHRAKAFAPEGFKIEDYIHLLKSQNAQITI